MSDAKAEDAKAAYERALTDRRAQLAEAEGRARAIGTVRALVVLAMIALVGAIVWAHLPTVAWGLEGALAFVFATLVLVHARVHTVRDRHDAAVKYYDRGLARLAGAWSSSPSTGARFAKEDHAYTDDLDVFGPGSLFQFIDATSTRFGEERLAAWLSAAASPHGDTWPSVVKKRQDAVKELVPMRALAEELAVLGALLGADKPDPRGFITWAAGAGTLGASSLLAWVARLVPVITIGLFFLGRAGVVPSLSWIGSFLVGLAISASMRARVQPIVLAAQSKESGLSRYASMIALVEGTDAKADALVALKAKLASSGVRASVEVARLARIVGFVDARENEVFRIFIAPFFLWDLNCALFLDVWRTRAGGAIGAWFEALGDAEALCSLATFAYEGPDRAWPELVEEPCFRAKGLAHPLLSRAKGVANDVDLGSRGHALIVTGSNMSGKSTLLRAVGLAAALARAGAPVSAERLEIGPLMLVTSMRVRDSVTEGVSRFYAELLKLKRVVTAARAGQGAVLFLLDEVLHGTNARERLIGGAELVRELVSRGSIGAVSTHDLALGELARELPNAVENVHFEEQVRGEEMTFDYRLRPGVVESSNALRLMRATGILAPASS